MCWVVYLMHCCPPHLANSSGQALHHAPRLPCRFFGVTGEAISSVWASTQDVGPLTGAEQRVASQHPAMPTALPLHQLDTNLPNALKRGQAATSDGRSPSQSKKRRTAAAQPAAAAGQHASVQPLRAPAQRAVPAERKTVAAALSGRSAKENSVPAASVAPPQRTNLHAASTPAVWQRQPNAPPAGTAPPRPTAVASNSHATGLAQQSASAAADSAQRRPPQAMQLGSAGLSMQVPMPGSTAASELRAAMPVGAVRVPPLSADAGPLGAAAAGSGRVWLQGQALVDLARSAFDAAGGGS